MLEVGVNADSQITYLKYTRFYPAPPFKVHI